MPQPAQATSRAPTPLPPRSSCHRTPPMRRGLREQIRPPRVRIRTPQGRIWAQLARTGIAAMKEMTTTKVRTRGGKERRGGGRWKPCHRHPCGRADLRQPLRWRQGAGAALRGPAASGARGRPSRPESGATQVVLFSHAHCSVLVLGLFGYMAKFSQPEIGKVLVNK